MLLSMINMKLRDYYCSLDDMCHDLDVDKAELVQILERIDYHYDEKQNQFV